MIDVSPVTSISEFERFRFVRGEKGELAEIDSDTPDERLFLVLDCLRYRIARLHIFETDPEKTPEEAARFKREMETLSRLNHPRLNPVLCFGQDDTELFYADPVIDGESISDYLERLGPLVPGVALGLVLQLIEALQCRVGLPCAIEHFSTGNLFLKSGTGTPLELVFSDFGGWNRAESNGPETLVTKTGLALYSLLAGRIFDEAPLILFDSEASDTPEDLKNLVKTMLGKKADSTPFRNLGKLAGTAKDILSELEEPREVEKPRLFFRDWLLQGDDSVEIGPEYRPLRSHRGKSVTPASCYAFDAEPSENVSYSGIRFQLFPGSQSIPTEGWLEQHRCALRHPGRGFSNQLRITAAVPQGRYLLIGEERVESLDLSEIVRQHGPLEIRHALELGSKLNSALDSIERTIGSCPVWWLPPENLHLVTGAGKLGSLQECLNRYGTRAWQHLPVRLQLHQTAHSLLTGVDLPESLLKRMHSGIRNEDPPRRSAVLLPILCFSITGRRFCWEEELRPVEGIPREITDLLEECRNTLVEKPGTEKGRLLDRIASTLAGEPIPAFILSEQSARRDPDNLIVDSSLVGLGASTGGLRQSAPPDCDLSDGGEESFPPARRLDLSGLGPLNGSGDNPDTTESPTRFEAKEGPGGGEIESLGLVDDDTIWEFGTVAPVAVPAPGEDSEPREDDDDHRSAEGFGERLLQSADSTETGIGPRRSAEAGASSWTKVVFLALGTAAAILGIAWVIAEFASRANRRTLAEETFSAVFYPGMKTTRALPGPTPVPAEPAGSDALGLGDISAASESVRLGDESRSVGRFSDAVSYYLRALDLDPDSSEVRTLLWETLDAWSRSDDRPLAATEAGGRIENEDEFVPRAAWILADYHRKRDPALHFYWLTRSAHGGYAPHQRELGLIFSRAPREMKKAARWFQKAADGGDTEGQFHFGECLIFGKGIPRDPGRAVEYLSKAAEAGDGRAFELLGVCFATGNGVEADPARACKYFKRAVEAGNIEACYNLGACYARGDGVSKDEVEAARTFQRGAEAGDPACMYAYGRCLEVGLGASRSPSLAAKWIRKAALLDFEDARAWCGLNGILVKNETD